MSVQLGEQMAGLGGASRRIFSVRSTSPAGAARKVTLVDDAGKATPVRVHRFALVGPGDRVYIDPTNSGRISVLSCEHESDKIAVLPHFEVRSQLHLGSVSFDVVTKELTCQADLDHYHYLEGFHYKSSSSIVAEETEQEKKAVGGRRSVLLAYLLAGKRFIPAGYIELQMPLLMVKPRHTMFAAPFSHPSRAISWQGWGSAEIRKYANCIVRIARVVTSPELRGVGLARTLILTGQQFARQRWHVAGRRPLFMEISAEMLKYMDFATSAGLTYAGYTEGNLSRVHADLRSMLKGQKVSFGMMTLQKKYLSRLQSVASALGRPVSEVLERLRVLTESGDETELESTLKSLQPDEWLLFKKVLRFPIPYYICGLDEPTQEYVAANAPARKASTIRAHEVRPARIRLQGLHVTSTYTIPDSTYSRAIRDCFGLDGDVFRMSLVGPLSLEASGGNIVLITGPSGSGKSMLLRALDPHADLSGISVTTESTSGQPFDVGWMREICSDKPLIEHFSDRWGMERSIGALNRAGLAEAFVYLRPYQLLSRGQQYRARLAELSLGAAPVWLMDEFGADLDPFTARVVATNLRKHVVRSGRIAVIAAANNAHYIDALRPTRVINLRHNGIAETLSYKEYVDEFCIGHGSVRGCI